MWNDLSVVVATKHTSRMLHDSLIEYVNSSNLTLTFGTTGSIQKTVIA